MSILKKQNKKEIADLDLIKDDCTVVDYSYFKYNSEKYNGFGHLSPAAAELQWSKCREKIETLLNNNKGLAASIISAEHNINGIYNIRLTLYFGKVKVMAIHFNFNSEYIDFL